MLLIFTASQLQAQTLPVFPAKTGTAKPETTKPVKKPAGTLVKTKIRIADEPVERNDFVLNVRSFFKGVTFNCSVNDMIVNEFGQQSSNSLPYSSLQIASECKGQEVRYYWRYLKDSRVCSGLLSFLTARGLDKKISEQSYIVYLFKDNKLVRVNFRLFPNTEDVNHLFLSAVGQNVELYPEKYQVKSNNYHFISGTSFKDVFSIEIYMCNEVGYQVCTNDWWH